MEMEEIIEKLKDILASEGQTNIKSIDIAKALNIHPDTFNSMKFRNSIPYKQIQMKSLRLTFFERIQSLLPKTNIFAKDNHLKRQEAIAKFKSFFEKFQVFLKKRENVRDFVKMCFYHSAKYYFAFGLMLVL